MLPILVRNVLGSSLGPATAVIGFLGRVLGDVGLCVATDSSYFHLQSALNRLEFRSGRLVVSV